MFKQFHLDIYKNYSEFPKINDRGILRVPFVSILTSPAVEFSLMDCLCDHELIIKKKFGAESIKSIKKRKLYLNELLCKLNEVDFEYVRKVKSSFDSKNQEIIYFGRLSFFNSSSFSNVFLKGFISKTIEFWTPYLEKAKLMKKDLCFGISSRNFPLPNGSENKGLYFFLNLDKTKAYEKNDFCPACNSLYNLSKHHLIPSAFFQDIKKKYNLSLSKNRKYNVVNFCKSCHALYESSVLNFTFNSRPAISDLFVLAARFSVINIVMEKINEFKSVNDDVSAQNLLLSLLESIDHEELLINQKLGIQFTDF